MPEDSNDRKTEKDQNIRPLSISRRELIKIAGLGLTALAGTNLPGLPTCTPAFAVDHNQPDTPRGTAAGFVPKPNKTQYVLKVGKQELNPDRTKPVTAITVNGTLPGPEIRAKEGEYLRLQVENRLNKQDTSIHWHGILVPAGMDGVPDISQAPIPPGQIYVYEYPILQSGTYWYHSHFGLQEQQGLSGPFIIEPKREPLQYDRDYVIFFG